jgi:acyl carrier protein
METRALIRAFLGRYFGNRQVDDAVDLFASGFINSMAALQLVLFVEKQFGVKVETEDLTLDNFRSVDALTALVERKQGAR